MPRPRWFRGFPDPVRRPSVRLRVEPLEDRLAPATRVWAGLGLDHLWSNHANWVGSVLPTLNDDLVFPSNAPRLANFNNLPGTIFNSVTFSGANYFITGNALGIRGAGISQTVPGTNTFELVTVFIGPEVRPISVAAGGTLNLNEELTGPGGFTKTGGGTLALGGTFANTYASVTTVQEGTLLLNKPANVRSVPGELVVGDGTGGVESDVVRLNAPGQLAAAPVTVNGSGLLALESSTVTLTGLTLNGGRVDTGSATLMLNGNITATAAGVPAVLRGRIDLGLAPRTLSVADGAAGDDLVLLATLISSSPLTKTGAGRLVFGAGNNLTGTMTVSAGVLTVRHAEALGATTAGTVIAAGAALELQGGINVGAEPLTLTGAGDSSVLRNLDGQNSWAGLITILSDVRFSADGGRLDLNGAIRPDGGNWGLTKAGAGAVSFGGAAANTYAGTTTVTEGTLILAKNAGIAAVAGPLVIGDAANAGRSTVVQLESRDQIADTISVMFVGNSTLDLNGFAETAGPLTFTGGRVSTGTGTLTLTGEVRVNASNAPVVFAGNVVLGGAARTFTVARGSGAEDLLLSAIVSGNARLAKEGAGVLRLTGEGRYTGPTTLAAGSLLVDGTLSSTVAVAAGATLGGSGSAAGAVVTGMLDPGTTTGILRLGALSFGPGSTVRVDLNGRDAGSTHDQLTLTQAPNLNGATLVPSLGFRSVSGTRYTILNNTSDQAVNGTFNGLPEGARLTVGGRPFTISYRGGDGNDVVLSDVSLATTTELLPAAVVLADPGVSGVPVAPRPRDPLGLQVRVQPVSGGGVPAGRVTVRQSGTTNAFAADLVNGSAVVSIPGLAIGSHTFVAEYEGDSTFSPSDSAPLAQVIGKALTSISLNATPNPVRADQPVKLVATLVSFQGGRAAGNITFREGDRALGAAPLQANGQAEFTVTGLTPGGHVLTAAFAGDGEFEASTATITVQAAPAGTGEERFVAQLYVDLLNRAVDPQGLSFWSGRLRQGASRTQVAQAIQGSEEFRILVVHAQYQRFLRRRADASGLRAFVALLGSGGTVEQVQTILVGSAEYYQAQGGGTDRGWLAAAYRDVFNRVPEDAGRAAHLAGLAAGATRQRIAEIIFASNEHRTNLVRDLYQRYLRRGAESAGLNAFVAELARGARQEQLAATMAGSGEYFGSV